MILRQEERSSQATVIKSAPDKKKLCAFLIVRLDGFTTPSLSPPPSPPRSSNPRKLLTFSTRRREEEKLAPFSLPFRQRRSNERGIGGPVYSRTRLFGENRSLTVKRRCLPRPAINFWE